MGIRSVKPILLNTEMVKAIIEDRKNTTRRVAFPNKDFHEFPRPDNPNAWWFRGRMYRSFDDALISAQGVMSICKYCPGDILYVRETWRPAEVKCDGGAEYFYFADGFSDASDKPESGRRKWRPSIHMPKEAARIWLRVTDVRVERVQEITDREAEKEGVGDLFYEEIGFGNKDYGCMTYSDSKGVIGLMKEQFAYLWDSTIKPADLYRYGWAANPWVWVVDFERCEKPKDAGERRRP